MQQPSPSSTLPTTSMKLHANSNDDATIMVMGRHFDGAYDGWNLYHIANDQLVTPPMDLARVVPGQAPVHVINNEWL
jgi:hypothetical protein